MFSLDATLQAERELNVDCTAAMGTIMQHASQIFAQYPGHETISQTEQSDHREYTTQVSLGDLGTCTLVMSNQAKYPGAFHLRSVSMQTQREGVRYTITVPLGGSPSVVNDDTQTECKQEDGFPQFAKEQLIRCAAALNEMCGSHTVHNLTQTQHAQTLETLDGSF